MSVRAEEEVAYSDTRRRIKLAVSIAVPIMIVNRSFDVAEMKAVSATNSNEKGVGD